MRQGSNSKRARNKGSNRGGNNGGGRNPLNRSYDSNGPAGKVRGNPHQVYEKYLSLARDAQGDDPVLAENLLQHADHYFRIINEAAGNKPRREDNRQDDNESDDDNAGNMAEASGDDGNADNSGNNDASNSEDDNGDVPVQQKRPRRPRRPKADAAPTEETASDAA